MSRRGSRRATAGGSIVAVATVLILAVLIDGSWMYVLIIPVAIVGLIWTVQAMNTRR